MKKSIVLFAILIFAFFSSQDSGYTIVYKTTYRPQKTKNTEKVEYMALEVEDLKSKFYNLDIKKMDSLVDANSKEITYDYKMPDLRWSVYKDLKTGIALFESTFNQIKFIYDEKPPKYTLSNKKIEKINNYNIKQATANFGGRTWEISYTPDIPINDGPYVFSGLPGLVYKAASQNSDYTFELVGIKKSTKLEQIIIPKADVKKEIYARKLQDFIKNPGYQNIIYKGVWRDTFEYKFEGNTPEIVKEQERQILKIVEGYNNPIDEDVFLLNF